MKIRFFMADFLILIMAFAYVLNAQSTDQETSIEQLDEIFEYCPEKVDSITFALGREHTYQNLSDTNLEKIADRYYVPATVLRGVIGAMSTSNYELETDEEKNSPTEEIEFHPLFNPETKLIRQRVYDNKGNSYFDWRELRNEIAIVWMLDGDGITAAEQFKQDEDCNLIKQKHGYEIFDNTKGRTTGQILYWCLSPEGYLLTSPYLSTIEEMIEAKLGIIPSLVDLQRFKERLSCLDFQGDTNFELVIRTVREVKEELYDLGLAEKSRFEEQHHQDERFASISFSVNGFMISEWLYMAESLDEAVEIEKRIRANIEKSRTQAISHKAHFLKDVYNQIMRMSVVREGLMVRKIRPEGKLPMPK